MLQKLACNGVVIFRPQHYNATIIESRGSIHTSEQSWERVQGMQQHWMRGAEKGYCLTTKDRSIHPHTLQGTTGLRK